MQPRRTGVLRLGHRAFGPEELLVMAVVEPAGVAGPAATMDQVRTVAAEGADIVVVASPDTAEARTVAELVATARDTVPDLVIGVRTGRLEVARAACAAGASLLCAAGADLHCAAGADLHCAAAADLHCAAGADLLTGWDGPGFGLAEVAAESGAAVICPPGRAARVVTAGVEPERIMISVASTGPLAEAVASGWPVLISLPDRDQDLAGGLATAAVAAWLGARVFRVRWVRETRRALSMVSAIRGDVPPAYAVRGLA